MCLVSDSHAADTLMSTMSDRVRFYPQVAAGGVLSPFSDAWALGCVVYQLLAGHCLHMSDDCTASLHDQLSRRVTFAVQAISGLQ